MHGVLASQQGYPKSFLGSVGDTNSHETSVALEFELFHSDILPAFFLTLGVRS